VSGIAGWLFIFASLFAIAAPAWAGVKTVNGISAEVNLVNAQRGVAYSQAIAPSGGGGAPYTFLLTAGALPAGFTLSSAGVVSGVNCAAGNGSFPFSARITSTTGTIADFTGSAQFSVQMTAGPGTACSLTLAALPTTGTVGTSYSGTATITGGTGPYTWAVTGGSLPTGLSLNTGTGAVTGTPTVAGTYSFTISGTDSIGAAGLTNYTVTIAPVITVSPTSLASGLQSLPYSQTVTATGGTAPYGFTVSAGTLPTGLSLSPTGVLSGTPTVAGSYNFTVRATDAGGFTGIRAYTVSVSAAPTIVVSPASLPGGLQNQAYASQTLTASGGTAPYTFAVTGGALPAGLSLASGGALAGTPTASGTFNFTVTATDTVGYTASRVYSLVVTPQPTIVVDPVTLPAALQNLGYSQTISASGGTAAYAFAVTSGALPAGLTLSSAGVLSGTPTVAGTFSFTVTASDANAYTGARAYTLSVTPEPVIGVTPPTLPGALQLQSYSQVLGAAGGTSPYTFTVTAGTLPDGVSLSPSGVLAGTPSVAGTFSFTVQAADANGYVGMRAYSLAVTPAPTIALSPASLPTALEHLPYVPQSITAAGGTAPYTYDVTNGSLPAGMSLSAGGVLSGTPSDPGPFTFTVTATDANGYTGSRVYTLEVTEAPTVTLTPLSLPTALENLPYPSQNVVASGGTAAYAYAVTIGTLPAGVTLTGGGVLSGTPTQGGTFNFTVTATDANGYTGERSYSLDVTPQPTISLSPVVLPDGFQNQAYPAQTMNATGGTAAYTFAITGASLPPGMTLSTGGVLSGTPTASGVFGFEITATDANGYAGSRSYSIDVTAQPTISVSPASLPGALQNQAYATQSITAAGGTAPYGYAVTSGALPAGLVLDPDGTLSGTPTASGSFNFSVTATDANNYTGVRAYALVVAAAPTISVNPASVPDGLQGLAYATQTITASGGTAPYAYSVTAGALPVGLTLSSGGALGGTPTSSGAFSFTITATDANNYAGSRAYTMNVTPASTISVGPPSLPDGNEDLPYAQTIVASGGTGPYTFVVTAGALPAGVTLTAGGALSGTPTGNGIFNFTVTATDSLGFTGSQAYALDITAAPTIVLNPAGLPGGLEDQPYATQSITASGGTSAYSYAVTGGALPAGLTLGNDGTLSGTPTASGTFNFTVTATDANGYTGSRAYSIPITAAPTITVNPATLPAASQNLAYASQTFVAAGGNGPYSFATTGGSLPAGMTLATDGTFSGTPTASGSFSFTVAATDANGYTGSRALTLLVTVAPTITLAPLTLPVALEDRPYSAQTITASGGTAPYTYAITAGALPSGLNFTSGGVLSGTPGVAGAFTFTVTATDADGYEGSLAYTLDVTVQPTITLSPAVLPTALENQAYAAQTIAASGGTAPYTYAVTSGSLPAGVALSTAGVLAGTPAENGAFNFTVTATDANGYTANRSYTLDVAAQPTITLSPITLPTGLQDQVYAAQTIAASGGTAAYSYSITTGALPAGLGFSGAGVITGTPTASGTFTFTVTAIDANGYTGSQEYTIDVTAAPTIVVSPSALPAGLQGVAYAEIVAASGGTPAYTYVVTSGALPAGLALASDGTFSGTPSTAGTASFTVTATDANGYSASQAYELTINEPLQAMDGDPVPAIGAGGAITPFTPVTAVGGTAPYTYSISPGLPAGMSFDPATGEIAGSPTQSQPLTTYTVTIQDASGATATRTFDLEVLVYSVSFTPATADLGRAGLPVDLRFVASGGFAPYVFAIESGGLPGGLALDSSGHLTGRSAQAGTYTVQVRVTDDNGATAVQTVTFTVGEPRPDPTLDAGVQALQAGQVDSIRRFGRAQTDNTVRRLEQLRSCQSSSNTLNVQAGDQGSVPVGQLAQGTRQAECSQQRSAWIAGTVVMTDGVDGGDDPTTDGLTVGLDYRVTDTLTLGAGIGYSSEGESRLAGGAKLSGDGYNAVAYGSWKLQPQVFVEGLVGYGSASYDLVRSISEESARASASRDASHWFGSLGVAANLTLSRTYVQPYLRADYQSASFDAYRERSVSSLALHYDSLDADTTRYTGGVRAHWSFDLTSSTFEPMLRLEYRGESHSSLSQRLAYADGLDGIDYTLRTASDDVSSGLVGAGFGLRLLNGFSAELEYQMSFGSDLPDEQSVSAMLNWAF
jgi:outer membrane autotransporter protein